MYGIYCVYKQSRPCQLPFCASPIFHFEIVRLLVSSLFVVSNVISSRGFSIACSYCFFVVVRKWYCLQTSYQNIRVISLIPTCLQSFIHQSI